MAKECDSKTCDKSSCEGCASKKNPQSMQAAMNAMSNVKHVIGIVSGKGGVGKSFVTASLANRMAKKGYKVGILDADITGPSIPKMYGLKGAAQETTAVFSLWRPKTESRLCPLTCFFQLRTLR